MSNAVYPALPGLTFNVTRVPIWSTTTKTAVSQREYRTANVSYPRYSYKLSYEFLREGGAFTELSALAGFFNARNGSFDSFLFTDPDDNAVTAQSIGAGNGSTRTFQLTRSFGGYAEPVFDPNGSQSIYLNGTLTTAYSIGSTGVVTFNSAPGAGVAITWTGTFYRRVRFVQDSTEFNKFMQNLWDLKTVELISVKP